MHMHDIIADQLEKFRQLQLRPHNWELEILETGTIRQDTEAHRQGDGWSTVAFAGHVAEHGGEVTSIDLHIETAQQVLVRERLAERVTLRQGYSIDWMASMLAAGQRFDVILLDSENDAQLILHEFMIATKLLRRPGLILVDDVVPGSNDVVKGQQLLPWLDGHKMEYDITPRTGGGVRSGVLATILP
jgi:hypothetical protein